MSAPRCGRRHAIECRLGTPLRRASSPPKDPGRSVRTAAAVGVSRPVVYDHFAGQDSLAAELIERYADKLFSREERAFSAHADGGPRRRTDSAAPRARFEPRQHGLDRLLRVALEAERRAIGAVQLEDLAAAGGLVQPVDVLRHHGGEATRPLEPRECAMAGVQCSRRAASERTNSPYSIGR
jgi:AcrR family transcriptional regulator